jgi:hypothetical protein
MEQRIFRSRIDALRRELMDACELDLLIGYSDDILSAGAVRYLTDFDMYAMYGLAMVPRRGDVVLAFGLHHSAYLVRVRQAAIADHYAGTYHPGELCAELLAETRPRATPRVGVVGGAHMFNSIDADLRAKMPGAAFVDVDREFWIHYFASLDDNGVEPSLRRSAVIAGEAVAHAQRAFASGQRTAAQIGAGATLVARRMGADIMNRELVQVLCASGMPLPATLSPVAHSLPAAESAFAIEISSPYVGQRSVCGQTMLREGAHASGAKELSKAAEVHTGILGLLRIGTTSRQIAAEAHRLAHAAGFGFSQTDALGNGIGLDLRQAPYLVPGDATALASGMTLAVRTRLQSERLGTIHRTDTVLVAKTGPDVLTARASRA